MKTKIIALVGVAVLLAALGLEAVKQVKAQGRDALGSLPLGFVVVDSTGKPVGPVIGAAVTGNAAVTVRFRGKDLPVWVSRFSFAARDLYFTSSDCTGQPYTRWDDNPFPATALGPDNILYAESGPSESVTINSVEFFQPTTCAAGSYSVGPLVPVAPAVNLNEFTPPFSVVGRSLLP